MGGRWRARRTVWEGGCTRTPTKEEREERKLSPIARLHGLSETTHSGQTLFSAVKCCSPVKR
eukprot:319688-Rhodomonas_salina.1